MELLNNQSLANASRHFENGKEWQHSIQESLPWNNRSLMLLEWLDTWTKTVVSWTQFLINSTAITSISIHTTLTTQLSQI